MSEDVQARPIPWLPCFLAWLIPGAGHLYLGKRNRGFIFFSAITLMFTLGIVLGGRLSVADFSHLLTVGAKFADMGNGIAYFLATMLGAGEGRVLDSTYEYATMFLRVSGLLNWLVILDVYDISIGKKG